MDIPVLCLDTCIILDMLRDPTRPDLRVHDHEASLVLLNAAESGPGVETLVAQQVGREFRDNADRVEDEARNRIAKRRADVGSLNRLVALYGARAGSIWPTGAATKRAAAAWPAAGSRSAPKCPIPRTSSAGPFFG